MVVDMSTVVEDKSRPGTAILVGGPAGESAYAIAVDEGFVGTPAEWLASLIGPPGPPGPPGDGDGTTSRTAVAWAGHGPPATIIGSSPGDAYLDLDTYNIYTLGA